MFTKSKNHSDQAAIHHLLDTEDSKSLDNLLKQDKYLNQILIPNKYGKLAIERVAEQGDITLLEKLLAAHGRVTEDGKQYPYKNPMAKETLATQVIKGHLAHLDHKKPKEKFARYLDAISQILKDYTQPSDQEKNADILFAVLKQAATLKPNIKKSEKDNTLYQHLKKIAESLVQAGTSLDKECTDAGDTPRSFALAQNMGYICFKSEVSTTRHRLHSVDKKESNGKMSATESEILINSIVQRCIQDFEAKHAIKLDALNHQEIKHGLIIALHAKPFKKSEQTAVINKVVELFEACPLEKIKLLSSGGAHNVRILTVDWDEFNKGMGLAVKLTN